MKKLLIFLTLFLIMGCAKTQKIETVPAEAFASLSEEDVYTIIDVRTAGERTPENGGKVFEDSLNIDFMAEDFREKLEALDRDQKYLIYCRSGNRSGQALEVMKQMGFMDVTELSGGIKAWTLACNEQKITCS